MKEIKTKEEKERGKERGFTSGICFRFWSSHNHSFPFISFYMSFLVFLSYFPFPFRLQNPHSVLRISVLILSLPFLIAFACQHPFPFMSILSFQCFLPFFLPTSFQTQGRKQVQPTRGKKTLISFCQPFTRWRLSLSRGCPQYSLKVYSVRGTISKCGLSKGRKENRVHRVMEGRTDVSMRGMWA